MTILGLVRHGVTEWNRLGKAQGQTDTPLADEGREQARKLALRLSGEGWEGIISSPLSRARETADLIAQELDIPVLAYDSRIIEKGFGLLEGTSVQERIELWGEDWKNLDFQEEPNEAVRERWSKFLEDTAEFYPGKKILVVSHGAFIGQALELIGYNKMDNPLRNCSLTILHKAPSGVECLLYNCTKHFDQ